MLKIYNLKYVRRGIRPNDRLLVNINKVIDSTVKKKKIKSSLTIVIFITTWYRHVSLNMIKSPFLLKQNADIGEGTILSVSIF